MILAAVAAAAAAGERAEPHLASDAVALHVQSVCGSPVQLSARSGMLIVESIAPRPYSVPGPTWAPTALQHWTVVKHTRSVLLDRTTPPRQNGVRDTRSRIQ